MKSGSLRIGASIDRQTSKAVRYHHNKTLRKILLEQQCLHQSRTEIRIQYRVSKNAIPVYFHTASKIGLVGPML